VNVRLMAFNEVGRCWYWFPGKTLIPVEEKTLTDWKESFYGPVLRGLGDDQAMVRAGAVACLAALPIDSAAAPAIAYLRDKSPEIRKQVLTTFANRPNLLDNESLLRMLGDPHRGVSALAEQILSERGLTQEQIGLGGLIVHPRPEVRESVLPLVAARTDIDPVIWMIYLSRDDLESIRIKAAEALASRDTPEARGRLAEMAISDPSPKVKRVAGKLIAPGEETASLPPLPGSPSLTPKAN
jgi:HEAT repeat protein